MRKTTALCLSTILATYASAATFDIKGRSLNEKQAKNPGIVSIEKDKAIVQNNQKQFHTSKALAKISAPDYVTKTSGAFNSNTNAYTLNGHSRPLYMYLDSINYLEQHDTPRNTYTGLNYTNSAAPYPSKSGNCTVVSKPDNESFYIDRYALFTTLALQPVKEISGGRYKKDCSFSNVTNTCGAGINVYNVVADNAISFSGNNCNTSSVTRNYTYGIQHYYANSILKGVAPEVSTSSINEGNARVNGYYVKHPQNAYASNKHIGNTIATSTTNVTLYNEEAAELDDYIYHNRVIEFTPFAVNGQKTGAGISLNAISVAGINDDYAMLLPNVTRPRLANATGADYYKPEIYVPSYYYNSNYDYTRAIKHDGNTTDFMAVSDGWGASTIAAGMAADLLSKYPFYKWHPEVVKALMLTAYNPASNYVVRVNTNSIYQYNYSMLNQGQVLSYKHIPMFDEMMHNNVSRYWYGNNGDFFNSNEILSFTENVEQGQKYNLAIAWLVRGDYAMENRHLSSNYIFSVYNNQTGALISTTMYPAANFLAAHRVIEMTVPQGVSKIRVDIKRKRNTGDRVILGYNIHKVLP